MPEYADVILPLPLPGTFTYAIPLEMRQDIGVGMRVYVQFGYKKHYTAIVSALHSNAPKGYEVKPIITLLDTQPIVHPQQLQYWRWIADYYLCTVGETYKAAIPAGLKIESETYIEAEPDPLLPEGGIKLSKTETAIMDALKPGEKKRLAQLEEYTGIHNLAPAINRLLGKGLIKTNEQAVDKYISKKTAVVKLNANPQDNEWLHHAFDTLARAPKQERLLITFLELARRKSTPEVTRQELLEKSKSAPAILTALVQRGIMRIEQRIINRFITGISKPTHTMPELSAPQRSAYYKIVRQWKDMNVVLLHGVTGSGKTEIYCKLIEQVLQRGQQVLMLVPEISLTTQLTDRLRNVFDDTLIVYHSKFSDSERVDIWNKVRTSQGPQLILGVRSSVFLPYDHLGLIIVDEEHEASYKQQNPAPRYNARDAAIMLAYMSGCKTLLGSATPAIDTYYKATTGKYGLVELLQRYQEAPLPEVQIVDMIDQRRRKLADGIISEPLNQSIQTDLKQNSQTILFQNRRGFAPTLTCTQCAWKPKCAYCDVSLVLHKHTGRLHCHYCGYSIEQPKLCPACGQNSLRIYGFGTERIAEEIHLKFPQARVVRMDLDTTRNKNSYQEIIEEFAKGDTDILIGTQMVSKGLDFAKVKTVGVMDADTLLHFPDFRANERAFNMLVQVAGRAGRRQEQGYVIIQASDHKNPLLPYIVTHDYNGYYHYELEQRRKYAYPPFTKIIMLYIKHRDARQADSIARQYADTLRQHFKNRVLGPTEPSVSRIATFYIRSIMIKVETGVSMVKIKTLLHRIYAETASQPTLKNAQIYYDVDPV